MKPKTQEELEAQLEALKKKSDSYYKSLWEKINELEKEKEEVKFLKAIVSKLVTP
jgi:hypothetical protein